MIVPGASQRDVPSLTSVIYTIRELFLFISLFRVPLWSLSVPLIGTLLCGLHGMENAPRDTVRVNCLECT